MGDRQDPLDQLGEHEKAGGFMRPIMVKERAEFLKSG